MIGEAIASLPHGGRYNAKGEIGNRISLTREQTAEQVGSTPQAISQINEWTRRPRQKNLDVTSGTSILRDLTVFRAMLNTHQSG
jgi:hypothetical protein